MNNTNTKISFVVLCYNRIDIIEKNIDRVLEIDWPNKEIVIVDNCSTDGSRELIRQKYANLPEVVYVESEVNGGVCPGRNQGFKKASGDYIIYLDDDSIAPLDICEKTIALFAANPEVGCLAYSVYNMPSTTPTNNYSNKEFVGNYHGAGHAFRKEVFQQAGYLDEQFFFGGEEVDHTISMYKAGLKTRYTPEVKVEHYVKTPNKKVFSRRISNWMACMNFVYIKHFPWRYALPLILRQWLAISFAGIKRKTIVPIFKGPYLTLKGLSGALKKRNVMPHKILAFYLDPTTRPRHCRIPFAKSLSDHHARIAEMENQE